MSNKNSEHLFLKKCIFTTKVLPQDSLNHQPRCDSINHDENQFEILRCKGEKNKQLEMENKGSLGLLVKLEQ